MPVLTEIGSMMTWVAGEPELKIRKSAAIAWEAGTIRWVGEEKDLPAEYQGHAKISAGGGLVLPGLIDCHTHLAFGGWRAEEFVQRIQGASYLDIAARGGGIRSTVEATRSASFQELKQKTAFFLREISKLGVTTVECKSGYGLSLKSELKLLRVYQALQEEQSLRVIPTLLGAHVLAPEFEEDRKGYVDLICQEMIPAVARQKLAHFCDVFLEDSAFSRTEARQILETGRKFGLNSKIHADQLTPAGGAELAAELGAVSADHLECVSEEGILAMARAGVTAVTLPIANLYLDQEPPPARAMLEAGLEVAIATDFNPGSAPSFDLPLAMLLACTRQRMLPAEVLRGVTLSAARALGIQHETGSIEAGKSADLMVAEAPSLEHWIYHYRPNACLLTVARGRICWNQEASG